MCANFLTEQIFHDFHPPHIPPIFRIMLLPMFLNNIQIGIPLKVKLLTKLYKFPFSALW